MFVDDFAVTWFCPKHTSNRRTGFQVAHVLIIDQIGFVDRCATSPRSVTTPKADAWWVCDNLPGG